MVITSAPRGAVLGPLREAMTTLAISLALLGLALVLAMVFQTRLGLRLLERLRRALADVRAPAAASVSPAGSRKRSGRSSMSSTRCSIRMPRTSKARAPPRRQSRPRAEDAAGDARHRDLHRQPARSARWRSNLSHRWSGGSGIIWDARAWPPSPGRRGCRRRSRRGCVDLGDVLGKIHPDRSIGFTMDIPASLAAGCEQQDFDEMAGNLLDNAFIWARTCAAVSVSLGDGMLHILVDDDGPGLPLAQRAQVLRPGERLDEAAPGSGLGPLDCQRIGGALWRRHRSGGGAVGRAAGDVETSDRSAELASIGSSSTVALSCMTPHDNISDIHIGGHPPRAPHKRQSAAAAKSGLLASQTLATWVVCHTRRVPSPAAMGRCVGVFSRSVFSGDDDSCGFVPSRSLSPPPLSCNRLPRPHKRCVMQTRAT